MIGFERLSALDATFLDIEDGAAHMHVGAVVLFQGQAPEYHELLALVASRLERVPRYRQRLARVPFGRPVWVDDERFDLERHVRQIALPAPGGDEALKKLAGLLFGQRLERDQPLWDLWLVEGLGPDRFAVITRTHHCMVDGVSGVDVSTAILDPRPEHGAPPPPAPWTPRPTPGPRELYAASLRERVAAPVAFARHVREPAVRRSVRELVEGLKPLGNLLALGRAPATSLNAPTGPRRRWDMATLDFRAVKRVRAAFGSTSNDVVLAVVAGALGELFAARGERPPNDLRVMVPVSVRNAASRGAVGNRVSAMFCALPTGEADPAERLRKVMQATREAKARRLSDGALALCRIGDLSPAPVVSRAVRLHTVLRWFNLIVTNIPGPRIPLYLLGRRMLAGYPIVPLAQGTTLGIALLGYGDTVGVGLLGDGEATRDLGRLAAAIPPALAELTTRAEALGGSAGARPNRRDPTVATG
jgi:WS/DGAT/MGAT family acyltransferase